jgi:hypothetical protein
LPNHWNHQISGMARWQAIQISRWNAFNFRQLPIVWSVRKDSLRHEPQPQAIGQDGHGADPAEPKYEEPRQTLRQRWRLLLNWHQ